MAGLLSTAATVNERFRIETTDVRGDDRRRPGSSRSARRLRGSRCRSASSMSAAASDKGSENSVTTQEGHLGRHRRSRGGHLIGMGGVVVPLRFRRREASRAPPAASCVLRGRDWPHRGRQGERTRIGLPRRGTQVPCCGRCQPDKDVRVTIRPVVMSVSGRVVGLPGCDRCAGWCLVVPSRRYAFPATPREPRQARVFRPAPSFGQ